MAVLDGQLVVPDDSGRMVFSTVIARRKQARYFAFDLLWLNGEDSQSAAFIEPKGNVETHFPFPSTTRCTG